MADDDGQGQGSDQDQGSEGDKDKKTGDDDFDKDRALATIKTQRESENKLKSELGDAKTKLADLEGKAKASDDAKKSEAEKLASQIEELKGQVADSQKQREEADTKGRARVMNAAIKVAATGAGATYPDDVPKLIDAREVEFDDDGEPTNVDKLVAALKKSRPALFTDRKPGSADGGPRGIAPGGTATKEELLKSTPRL